MPPIAEPTNPVQSAWAGIEPTPLTRVVAANSAGPPNKATAMYCRFSIRAKPSPMLNPTRNPALRPLMDEKKINNAVALQISSMIGAPMAIAANDAWISDQ